MGASQHPDFVHLCLCKDMSLIEKHSTHSLTALRENLTLMRACKACTEEQQPKGRANRATKDAAHSGPSNKKALPADAARAGP